MASKEGHGRTIAVVAVGLLLAVGAASGIYVYSQSDDDLTTPATVASKTEPTKQGTQATSSISTASTGRTVATKKTVEVAISPRDYQELGSKFLALDGLSRLDIAARNAGKRGDRDDENKKQIAAEDFYRGVQKLRAANSPPDLPQALKYFQAAAAVHHPDAEYHVGRAFQHGLGTPISADLAVQWYQRSADSGNPLAACALGLMECEGVGLSRNVSKGTDRVRGVTGEVLHRATSGDPLAETLYGIIVQEGRGQPSNDTEAARWYRKASDQGDVVAMNRLATCYRTGRGVEQSDEEALEQFKTAAEIGLPSAQYNLGTMCTQTRDDEQAVRWFTLAAEAGIPHAQFSLARMYKSERGVPKIANLKEQGDQWYQRAAAAYRKEAETGNPLAQFYLGYQYENDLGVSPDKKEAVKWYRLSAEQGEHKAQVSLGKAYEFGEGVPPSVSEAVDWYEKAVAQKKTDELSRQARQALERLAAQGNARAKEALGRLNK